MNIHDIAKQWEQAIAQAAEETERETLDDQSLVEAAGLNMRSGLRVAGCKT